ncbi:MAG TPA: TIGR00341 family protein [Cyanobacteria bacterium UBA8803]|nr:TIGR00341 family protein [Cyanobacteria bacterium UBA9273]HBL57263.1 TIGR00341 family protein [Cyanobacteria bacterium UBA8803]
MLDNIRNRFKGVTRTRVQPVELQQLQTELLAESTPDLSYLVLIVGSCAIATFGLLSNSAAVIIGAMIVAPLMLPIRGLAFGALQGNVTLFRKGLMAVAIGTLLAVALAWCLGLLVGIPSYGSEVFSRSEPTLLDLGIAIAAGGISGYAKVQPKISGSLAGTAIAVALMPPICVIGLGLAQVNWSLSLGATLLYLTNLLGITLSCMLTFLLTGYTSLNLARKPLIWTLAFVGLLLIPLGISFAELVRQAQLESSLRRALLDRTITFQRVQLIASHTNWLTKPPQVHLSVRAKEAVTPKQVQLLEDFVAKEMGQPFTLIFEVSQVEEVRREDLTKPASKPMP